MASGDAVQFKVTLRRNGESVEIRRFAIDKDVVTNFSYLRQKLYSVFPVLQNTGMNVSWRDNEGDAVSIGSDDELIIALTEMEVGQLKKLDVSIVSQAGDALGGMGRPNRDSRPGSVHPGVTCDGCEQPVTGYRYKCVNCADYDLCSSCEQKGIHSEHVVIRYPSPMGHDHHLLKRLNKLCRRYRVSAAPEFMVYSESAAPRRGCPVSSEMVTDVIEDFLATLQSHAEVITPEMLQQIIANLSNLNLNGSGGSGDDQQAAGAATGNSGEACWGRRSDGHRRKCGDGFNAGKHPDETPSKKKDKRRKSGETVGATASASASASASIAPPQLNLYGLVSQLARAAPHLVSQLANMPSFSAAAGNGAGASATPTAGQSTPSAPSSSGAQPQSSSSNAAEATLMNVDEDVAQTSQQSSQPPAAQQTEPQPAQANSAPTDDSKKDQEQPSLSPESLERALKSMINMGFNNEGGWLRDLLVAKGGDITKVLDHLITSSKATTNPPIELD